MAQSFNTTLSNVAARYIRMMGIPATAATIKQSIEENPYYPSLYSISATFDRLQIPNEAYQLEPEQLAHMEPPFIAYMNNLPTGRDFALVTAINGDHISYITEGSRTQTVTKEQFLTGWENIVFVAEAGEQSGEPAYVQQREKEIGQGRKKTLLTLAAIMAMLLAIVLFFDAIPAAVLVNAGAILTIKLAGIAVAVLLLIYETDKDNSFVKHICSVGRQTNCDAILGSKAARIVGISWSEAGFFYFTATGLFLLWPGLSFIAKIPWIAAANMVAAPYILFSIYYQWRIARQWCPLCLTAQVVLAAELVWSIFSFWQQPVWPVTEWHMITAVLFCILLPVVAWLSLKPFLARKDAGYKAAYKRLLYNPEIFNGLLQQQTDAADGWQQLGITIGNPAAANTIIKVCNPYCGPCAKAHPVLDEIIAHNPDVNVRMIFTATTSEKDPRSAPVKHLLAIAAKGNTAVTQKALDDWYMAAEKDYQIFAGKYPMNGELKQQDAHIEAMGQWCADAEITHTPTVFINGKRLPETYSIEELKSIF